MISETEMIEVLEGIVREGGDTARIQAIKLLRDMNDGKHIPTEGFAELDQLAPHNGA